ncbi:putative membrane protein [Escherichia coli 3431]|nr:putative membrane protein [Escherichia coli 3431]
MIIASPVWVLGLFFYLTSFPLVLFLLGNMMFFRFLMHY